MTFGPIEVVTRSHDETRYLGATLAEVLEPGDLVSLTGDLGAGKTALVQGAARALGVEEPVASPTFVLARAYRGRMPVHHLDVYRLERLEEVRDLGFDDLVESGGVVFIEWGDAIEALLPPDRLDVEIRMGEGEDERRLTIDGHGSRWAARWERLEGLLQAGVEA